MRRILAAASVAALGLSLALPLVASAHDQANVHSMAWTASPNPTTANDGAQVYSNDEIVAAKIFMVDGVLSWDVAIRPSNGGPPSTCHEDLAPQNNRYPQNVYINCPWDTTRVTNHALPGPTDGNNADDATFSRTWQSQDLGPSTNGKYTIEITAKNANNPCLLGCQPYPIEDHPLYQSGTNPPRWREVWVVNGVSQPTGVTSSFDPGSNRIAVTWAPVPEPASDVSYLVQEKIGDGKWGGGGTVPGNATRFDRPIDQPGTYQYRVQAVRAAPSSNSGSGASATKKSDYAVASPTDVAQITPPSTAGANNANGAPDGGGGGGDSGGAVGSGDTPTTGGASGSPQGGGKAPKGKTAPGARSSGPITGGARPAGTAGHPTAATGGMPGEEEGEGADDGFSPVLPYSDPQDGMTEGDDGLGDEGGPQALGGVVPKPHDTRQLLVFMAAGLVLFIFAMQCTILLRRSKPALAASSDSDFDDWLGF